MRASSRSAAGLFAALVVYGLALPALAAKPQRVASANLSSDEILAEIRSGAAPKVVDEDTELGLRDALKEDFDRELARAVAAHDVGLVVGAGYMRVLSPAFLELFPAVLNVHPSLLPEFRGLRAVERALEAGVSETGVTVHFMVEEVDAGPVVVQEAVPVLPGDTKESLLERLHPVEHRLLVRAVADYFLGKVAV